MNTPDNEPLTRPNGDKLGGDSTESQFSLEEWSFVRLHLFTENHTLKWMREHFAAQFNKTYSTSTWGNIWAREVERRKSMAVKLRERREAAENARAWRKEAKESGAEFGETTLELIEQMAFDMAMDKQADVKGLIGLMSLFLKARDQQLDKAKFEAMRAKAEQADKAKEVSASTMTVQEKAARMREIFALG